MRLLEYGGGRCDGGTFREDVHRLERRSMMLVAVMRWGFDVLGIEAPPPNFRFSGAWMWVCDCEREWERKMTDYGYGTHNWM
jgi:hypothetical protein